MHYYGALFVAMHSVCGIALLHHKRNRAVVLLCYRYSLVRFRLLCTFCLHSKPGTFGSSWEPSKKFINAVLNNTSLVDDVVAAARRKGQIDLNRQLSKSTKVSGRGKEEEEAEKEEAL